MKTLLLLRHAKSSWKDGDLDDHDRPLNKRGKRDAPRMGRLLADERLLPDLILCSTAKRCRKTAEHVIAASGYRGDTRITGELYEADGANLRESLAGVSEQPASILLIAHNPGMEELLESLTGLYTPLTTAALAQVEMPIDHWRDLTDQTRGRLIRLWQPRELES
ncbi:MAG TPA: histidine phosphatase family protein [Pirellulaceae bacterium]|nr:histidine phosphatase family protein [Pirellulaceae bacterium]